MQKSNTLSNLFTALSKAQVELKNPSKGKTVQTKSYSYSYADLSTMLEEIKPVLLKHGLAVVQGSRPGEKGTIVETLVTHESGEWLETELELAYESNGRMNSAQEMGSALTYGRRYALSAILNIAADEDNDTSIIKPKTAPRPTTAPQVAVKTKLCPKHQNPDGSAMVMTEKNRDGKSWFSHQLSSGEWCQDTDTGTTEPK